MESGVPFIRVNDLLDLDERTSQLRMIPKSLSAQYRTTVVRSGDILISVVGTLVRAVLAGPKAAGANVARAVAVLRVDRSVDRKLLQAWLTGPEFERQALRATGSDSAQPTLGMEDLANFSVRWPRLQDERQAISKQVARINDNFIRLAKRLHEQICLIAERRQALITAAVTGQIDVTAARGADV